MKTLEERFDEDPSVSNGAGDIFRDDAIRIGREYSKDVTELLRKLREASKERFFDGACWCAEDEPDCVICEVDKFLNL